MKSYKERIETVRRIAQKLLQKYNLSPPVDLFALAEWEGIHVQYEGNQIGIEGLTKLDADPPVITLNPEQIYDPRIRFTLAHEIGHVKIPWHTGVTGSSENSLYVQIEEQRLIDSQELEANTFASELLIPQEWLRKKVGMIHNLSTVIEQVVQETKASTMACLYALENVLPAGHLIYVTTHSMDYWRAFCAADTCTWGNRYFGDMLALNIVCLKSDQFERGSYTIKHYVLQPCPEHEVLHSVYQCCNQDLGEFLNILTGYHPEKLLHCLDLVLSGLPDQFSLIIESYVKENVISYYTPRCYIRFPNELKTYEQLKDWVTANDMPCGELVLAGGKRLFWLLQPKYDMPPFVRKDSKQLLRQLVGRYFGGDTSKQVLWHINGIIGSVNSRNNSNEKELFSQLKARFSQDMEVRSIISDPDFDLFLRNRVFEIVARRHT